MITLLLLLFLLLLLLLLHRYHQQGQEAGVHLHPTTFNLDHALASKCACQSAAQSSVSQPHSQGYFLCGMPIHLTLGEYVANFDV
jgi:hypothetical protein